jgi:hypothetical protein
MPPLLDVLGQLTTKERKSFSAWFASLNEKEKNAVASELAETSPERIRTILSIPKKDRVGLLVRKDALDRSTNAVTNHLNRVNEAIKKTGLSSSLEALNDKLDRWMRKNL